MTDLENIILMLTRNINKSKEDNKFEYEKNSYSNRIFYYSLCGCHKLEINFSETGEFTNIDVGEYNDDEDDEEGDNNIK